MPRQTRASTSRTASAFGTARPLASQQRAADLGGAGQAGGEQLGLRPAEPGVGGDRVGDGLHAAASTRSTRSRTAGSLRRSDSKTSRNAPHVGASSSTKSK